MRESDIQKQIMLACAPHALLWRANAGEFWQGKRVWSREFDMPALINIRRIEGLPRGYSDLSGLRRSDGRAVFIECKAPGGRLGLEQAAFLEAVLKAGAAAGVARSPEEAIRIITGDGHV